MLVGIVLDLIITIPLFVIPSGGTYEFTFLNFAFVRGIIVVGIYDLVRKKN